jgi:hypothetical protein
MRRILVSVVGAISLTVAGCGAEADAPEGVGASEDVGVSLSELTNCTRTELANVVVGCGGPGFHCDFRFMENNFVCDEGVVGQASSEALSGYGLTSTFVNTSLFGHAEIGFDQSLSEVTIITQWGHVYGSAHLNFCMAADGTWTHPVWTMDPWSKRAVLVQSDRCW